MSFDQDPSEQANISGADFAAMCDEMAALKDENERLRADSLAPAGIPISADEMTALRRFHECATDGEGWDVAKPMMQRLAEIGLVRRTTASIYAHTDFGLFALGELFAAPFAPAGDSIDTPEFMQLLTYWHTTLIACPFGDIRDEGEERSARAGLIAYIDGYLATRRAASTLPDEPAINREHLLNAACRKVAGLFEASKDATEALIEYRAALAAPSATVAAPTVDQIRERSRVHGYSLLMCYGCEGKYDARNNPCEVCGTHRAALAAPDTGKGKK
jgi:hypothetical protein